MIKNLPFFLLLTCIFFSTYVLAQPELDTTFGGTGKFPIQFGAIGNISNTIFQPDNKLIHVGSCFSINFGNSALCVMRLNENGSFDTTFGNPPSPSGVVIRTIPGLTTSAEIRNAGGALQSDGKIISFGHGTFSGQRQPWIVRLASDGTLDTSFGNNGVVLLSSLGTARSGEMLIQPDDKILIVGFTGSTAPFNQFVARFNPNGSPDTSFGNNGVVLIAPPGFTSTTGISIALRQDGKIITGGSATGGVSPSLLLTRLNKNGSLDTTFDGDGYKTEPWGADPPTGNGYFGLLKIQLQSDGRILGLSHTNNLYRFNTDGSLDPTFDGDGSRPGLNSPATATAFTVSASGRITVGGTVFSTSPRDYRLARYLPDGTPDTTFSGDGLLEIDVFNQDGVTFTGLDLKGRTLISGYSANGSVQAPFENSQYSNARLLAPPTQNVGFSGRVTDSGGKPLVNAFVTLSKDSETIAIGRTNPFGYFNFKNIPTNQTYKLSTRAKNLNFNDRNVLVDDAVSNFLVIGDQP